MTTSAPLITVEGAPLEGIKAEDQTVSVVLKHGGVSGQLRKRGLEGDA